MPLAPAPRILLCSDAPPAADEISRLLEQAGFAVGRFGPAAEPADLAGYHLVVLDGGRGQGPALQACRRLRARPADGLVPILFVISDPTPAGRLAALEAGADACLPRPFTPGELLAQVRAFLRIRERHDNLAAKAAEAHRINQRLQRAYQVIDQEIELARRIQRSFLPQALPELPRMRFAVHYRPCGRVGGDFYDVFRLDEQHVGLYVADAMGHGVPAGLLTIFVKKGVQAKEIFGSQYRLVPPADVLRRLNRDLLAQALAEMPFVTMVYVLLNHQDGTLHFARSGHPYPLYLPAGGGPELWQVEGSLLGVFDTEFPQQARRLRPGDKVLLYTDGVDAVSFEGHPPGAQSLLACAARHRGLPVGQFVERVAHDLGGGSSQGDDLTLLGVEMC
jgi:sigma-B regulation protein RsbU (phosphoserine phosphatase)